jgi:hypothetical protein
VGAVRKFVIVAVAALVAMGLAPVTRALPSIYTYASIDYPGAGVTQAWGVNNQGQVVGDYGDSQAAIYDEPPGEHRLHGFLLDRGTFSNIDVSDTVGTHPQAISESGSVAGFTGDYDQRCCAHTHIGGYLQHRDGTVESIENKGLNMFVQDTNDRGDVVGFSHGGNGTGPGFIWNDGVITEVAPAGAVSTYLAATDEPQIVIGGASPGGAFRYRNGTFSPLVFPSSMHNVSVSGTNNQGDFVGAYTDDLGQRGGYLLLANGQLTKINVPGKDGTVPMDVSDNRQIVGEYYKAGVTHGFIATPH